MTTVASEVGSVPFIRHARGADLLAVTKIEQASFPEPWPYSAFEKFLDADAFLVAIAREQSSNAPILGYVVADRVPNQGTPLGHIKNLAVHPDYRNEGIGHSLLERAVTALRFRNLDLVKLEVRESNHAARNLYQRAGFVHRQTIPQYYENGERALVMLKRV